MSYCSLVCDKSSSPLHSKTIVQHQLMRTLGLLCLLIQTVDILSFQVFQRESVGRATWWATANSDPKVPKLPIVQFLENGELLAEIAFTREDFDVSLSKLLALLNRGSSSPIKSDGITTVYSDEQLQRQLQLPGQSVLKLFSSHCQTCIRLNPSYEEFSRRYGDQFHFLQADAAFIPDYTLTTVQRLQGTNIPTSDGTAAKSVSSMESCRLCQGLGVLSCVQCAGRGYHLYDQLAVFCSDCGGKKMTRCFACGGRCTVCG